MRFLFFTISFCLIFWKLQGQELKYKNFDLQISTGVSIPTGAFAKTSYEDLLLPQDGLDYSFYIGIEKAGHAYAKPGRFMGLGLAYQLQSGIKFSLNYQDYLNPLEVNKLDQVIREGIAQPIERTQFLEHNEYELENFLFGVSYVWSKERLTYEAGFLTGKGRMQYPNYQYFYDPFYIGNDRQHIPINSLVKGLNSSISYSILSWLNAGLRFQFIQGDFPYEYERRLIPGGSNVSFLNDEINFRSLSIGLQLQMLW
ncbi:hypothetical protein [Algoriphagus algorifonticola]|uniref:hypothetical protein n=1 Tax=Algoriphagus algorifonticola TaxID=2593007 RepID=UPI0011A6077A|nr:hypothetical protein [Algoriphagus algorifonticola]